MNDPKFRIYFRPHNGKLVTYFAPVSPLAWAKAYARHIRGIKYKAFKFIEINKCLTPLYRYPIYE